MYMDTQPTFASEVTWDYILVELPQGTVSRHGALAWRPVKDLIRKCLVEHLSNSHLEDNEPDPGKVEIYSIHFASWQVKRSKWAKPCYDILVTKYLEGVAFNAWHGTSPPPGDKIRMIHAPRDHRTGHFVDFNQRLYYRAPPSFTKILSSPSTPNDLSIDMQALSINGPSTNSYIGTGLGMINTPTTWALQHIQGPVPSVSDNSNSRSSSISAVSSAMTYTTDASTVSMPFNPYVPSRGGSQNAYQDIKSHHGCPANRPKVPTVKVFYKPLHQVKFVDVPLVGGIRSIRQSIYHLGVLDREYSVRLGHRSKQTQIVIVHFENPYTARSLIKSLAATFGQLIGNAQCLVVPTHTNNECLRGGLPRIWKPHSKPSKKNNDPTIIDGSVTSPKPY